MDKWPYTIKKSQMSFGCNIQNFDDWYCIFISTLEPKGEYIQLLPDLITWVSLLYKNQIESVFDQLNTEKLISQVIPNTISKLLNFSSNLSSEEIDIILSFLKKCAKFAFFAIVNNYKPTFPSLIKLFDESCIFYKKNDFFCRIYDKVVQQFIDYVKKHIKTIEPLEEYSLKKNQDDIESFHTLFKICHHLSQKFQYSDFSHKLVAKMVDYFYVFLQNIQNLRELNSNSLKGIFSILLNDNQSLITKESSFQMLSFFITCLKSDYVDKQLFAAQQISDFCDKPKLLEFLLDFNLTEINIIELIIKNSYHHEVMSILIKFLTQMANQKILTIDHLCQLWEKSQNLHITEKKGLFEFISNCLDFFNKDELKIFFEHLYSEIGENKEIYLFLSDAVLAIQHKDDMKELCFDIINHLFDDIHCVESNKGITNICSHVVASEIYQLIADRMINYICDESLNEFSLIITLKLIKNADAIGNIFNDDYVNKLIHLIQLEGNNSFDNRKSIFLILHVLYTSTILKPNSEIFNELISMKIDDILFEFFRKLLIADGVVDKGEIKPIEQLIKRQNLEDASAEFANLLIAFVFYMNRNLFLNAKLNSDVIEEFHLDTIELNYFDLLFELYLKSENNSVSSIIKDFIIKIYKNCNKLILSTKDIQQRIDKLISENELQLNRILWLLFDYLQISEMSANSEDFKLPSHKYSKKFLGVIIKNVEGNKVLLHVNPNSTVKDLKNRISIHAAIKEDCLSIPEINFERNNKLVSKLNFKFPHEFPWKSTCLIRQICCSPPSCELHKNHFSDCLLELLDNEHFSEDTFKIIWKLLKYLPTNEDAISTLDNFDSFISILKNSKNPLKCRYYLQIFQKKNLGEFSSSEFINDSQDQNIYINEFVNLFQIKKYPKKELLQIFKLFDSNELFAHAKILIPELLNCILTNEHLIKLINEIFSIFLKVNSTEMSSILMSNSAILTEIIHKLSDKDWGIFIDLLSNSLDLNEVTDLCIRELTTKNTNKKFFLQLQGKIIPKLKEAEERINKLFDICIGFMNDGDSFNNEVLDLFFILISKYPELLKNPDNFNRIPIDKIISIAFSDPPESLQTVLFKILSEIIKTLNDLGSIKNIINEILSIKVDRWNYDPSYYRKIEPYVGLHNLGATCFVNSVLQQLFHLYPIRYLLLMHQFEPTNEYSNLQCLFQQMMFTERSFCNPIIFLGSWHGWYGQLINPREQQDSLEFYMLLVENDNEKNNNEFPTEVNQWLKGEMTHRLKGVNDPFDNKSIEMFYSLSLSIKGFKNIKESFNEFNQIETHDDYGCENPKRTITVHKSTRISKPPIVLVIQLNRFEYDLKNYSREKINDKFEFPDDLDISEICDGSCEKDICLYELHGIVVHTGNAYGGHYKSIINLNNQWYLFNDSEVSKISREEMEKTCYGDNSDKTSAYLLFYIRKNYSENVLTFNENNDELNNVLKQEKFSDEIKNDNILFKRTQSLFSNSVINFFLQINDFEINVKYFINILCHSNFKDKSKQFHENLIKIIHCQNKEVDFINYLIDNFDDVFDNYLNCSDLDIMKNFNNVIIYCIKSIFHTKPDVTSSFKLCEKFYVSLTKHLNAFRQIPLILNLIENCISTNPELAINEEFNWLDKINQLISSAYSLQKSTQVFSSWDYSSLFRALITIIKIFPKNSIDCSFLLMFAQNILKSESNAKDFIELLLLCSRNQNIETKTVFDICSSTDNFPKIMCEYYSDLICNSTSYEQILTEIHNYINYKPDEKEKESTTTKKDRCIQLIQSFSNEIDTKSSIFISNFIKFSPSIVHDLITFKDEFVRSKCESLYYDIFKSHKKMSNGFSFLNSDDSDAHESYYSVPNSNKLFDNQMEQFLYNIENYLKTLNDLILYYPKQESNPLILSVHYSFRNESHNDETKFRLVSILKLYRWITYSIHNEFTDTSNNSYFNISDSFTTSRMNFLLELIGRFAEVNRHPDFHIRQLLLLFGEFPIHFLCDNLFDLFNTLFSSEVEIETIHAEFAPFLQIIKEYKSEEILHNDIISIFNSANFSKFILRILKKCPTEKIVKDLIEIFNDFKRKYPERIGSNESLCSKISDLSLANSVVVKNHFLASRSGGLIQNEVNRTKSLNQLGDISDDPDSSEISEYLKKAVKLCLKEDLLLATKSRIDAFIGEVRFKENSDENILNDFIDDRILIDSIKNFSNPCENLKYFFKLIKWYSKYSSKACEACKKLIMDIINDKNQNEALITETARFAAGFDFMLKKPKIMSRHFSILVNNFSPTIKPFAQQRSKKILPFLDQLNTDVNKSEKGEIDWIKDFAYYILINDGKSNQERDLKNNLVLNLSDDAILHILSCLESDFKKSSDSNEKELLLKSMAAILDTASSILEKMRKITKLTENDIKCINNPHFQAKINVLYSLCKPIDKPDVIMGMKDLESDEEEEEEENESQEFKHKVNMNNLF